MKSRVLKLGLCIIILISLVAASFALVRPVYLGLGRFMRNKITMLNSTLDERFGINVSYSSLSPSILTGINIKGIEVKDTATSETVLTIKKITAKFSILNILKGDFENAVSEIVVNDVYGELIRGKNSTWIEYIVSTNLEKKEEHVEEKAQKKSFIELLSDADINIDLPCNINVNNLTVVYEDAKHQLKATAYLRKAYAERTATPGKYSLELIGQISGGYKKNQFSSNIFVQSSVLKNLNNSSAVLQFFNTAVNSYSISQLGFLGEYSNAVFNFKMLPTVQNLYIDASANFKSHEAAFRFNSENFRLNHILNGTSSSNILSKVSQLVISARINGSYNWENKKIKYSASGDVHLPETLVPGSLSVNFALNGNQNYVNIPYINGTGNIIDAAFTGGINIRSLQPEGILSLHKFKLSNDGEIRTEVFFEPLKKGFMAFSPEVMFGEKTFTAAMLNFIPQSDGYDFDFEIYDYAHADSGMPGHLALNGNYVTASKFFQSNINLDGMYIDSLMQFVAFFLERNKSAFVTDASNAFKNVIFSTGIYISAYDGNFSYSVPSAIIADTSSDNRMLMVAFDGNKENLQLTRFELILDDQNIFATAHAENVLEAGSRNVQTILSGMVEYNTIPYSFSGLINKDWISISGDYGLNFTFLNDSDSDNLLGSFGMAGFPVKLKDSTLSITADTSFLYNPQDKINVNVSKFEVQSIDGTSQVNPVFTFTGKVDKSGTYLEEISYTDIVSNLTGNGVVMWNHNAGQFLGATFNILLQDPLYSERIELKGDISNPENKPLNKETVLNDFYISTEINLSSFRTGRFTGSNNSAETMNANVSVTGSLDNPFVSVSIPRGVISVNDSPAVFSLQASVVDREFEISSAQLDMGKLHVNKVDSKFSFNEWQGYLSLNATTEVMDNSLDLPLQVTVKGIADEEKKSSVPKTFEININSKMVGGTFIRSPQPLSVKILKLPEEIILSSSENLGLSGSISTSGEVAVSIENKIPFRMKIAGNVKKNFNLHFYDIDADLPRTMKLVNFNLLHIYAGKIVGDFWIRGSKNNRGFDGMVMIIPAEFSMPDFFRNHAKTDVIYLSFEHDRIFTPKTRCMLKKSPVDVTVNIQFKKMAFDALTVLVETVDETYAPVNINLNQVHVKGNAQVDLEIVVEPENISVNGAIVAKDTTAEFGTSTLNDVVNNMNNSMNADSKQNQNSSNVEVMLDVTMKSRVQVYYSSFLRGLVVPDSKVSFAYNAADEKMTLDGGVPLRSGEIIYLNSSFYIKEGRIDFSSEDEGLDPYITVRAETREKDENHNDVTITLAIDHQKISDLSPKLTSSPAKSEKEILELLGNFVSANSDNVASFMMATGDYALQTMVVRKIENALRDFLNFDILSIRTSIVQNALKYSVAQPSERQGMNVSNFFDNTTVYIGKYFGNALYADAMLRLSYNKNRINDGSTLQGLIFEPEIGLEMDSPLTKIRWSLAPDLSDLASNKIIIVPSLTLSWKFNY